MSAVSHLIRLTDLRSMFDKKAANKRYREKHREQIRQKDKRYYEKNKARLIPLMTEYTKQWRKKNPEKYRAQWIHANEHKKNRIMIIDRRIYLEKNPRIGRCSQCGKEGQTQIHHIEYHRDDPLRDTVELCIKCHRKTFPKKGEGRIKRLSNGGVF